jgi:hypothetical protein
MMRGWLGTLYVANEHVRAQCWERVVSVNGEGMSEVKIVNTTNLVVL